MLPATRAPCRATGRPPGLHARAAAAPRPRAAALRIAAGRDSALLPARSPDGERQASGGRSLEELERLLLDYSRGYAGQPGEHDCELTEVEGRIPADLQGTLVRNGPGQFERGGQQYAHFLDGDGYVTKFAFRSDGRVFFTGRFVRTQERQAEERANVVLFRSAFGTQRRGGAARNAFDLCIRNPANTNALLWGGRLLALWEAGPPYELDPVSLQTVSEPHSLGGWIWPGRSPGTTGIRELDRLLGWGPACTAHPHVLLGGDGSDGDRLVMWTWCSEVNMGRGTVHMEVAEFNSAWRRLRTHALKLPGGMVNPHDFAVTASSYVFFQSASRFDMAAYLLGLKSTAHSVVLRRKPAKIHVVDREHGTVQVAATEPCCMLHHANAWDEGGATHVWSSGWGPQQLQQLQGDRRMIGQLRLAHFGDFAAMPCASLWEHRIDRQTGAVETRALHEGHSLDFPTVNPRTYGRRSRFVFFTAATQAPGVAAPLQAFVRLDTITGQEQRWDAGPRSFCGELVFVPSRAGAGAEREDCGHLLGLVDDAATGRTSLVVMDASNFAKGPVARVWLPLALPHGIHGTFTPAYHSSAVEPPLGSPAPG